MQNILLKDNYQTLVLTDYGTATQLGKSWMTDNVGTPSMYLPGIRNEIFRRIFLVTMAPEVFAYNQYAEQCDTYSWAIVFWQLISKQLLPYGSQGKGLFKIQEYFKSYFYYSRIFNLRCTRKTSSTEIQSLSGFIYSINVSFMAFRSL